jgi:transposase-like protein
MEQELELLDARFTDPIAAVEYLEGLRWANGVVCPHCGESEREPYRLNSKVTTRRLWKCRACRKQFTVTVGTIFESSHIPPHKWLAAFYLLCARKEGMSAQQLHRMLKVTYKTAWSMFHRIREAMKEPAFAERWAEWSRPTASSRAMGDSRQRNGKLRIPMPLEDALKAATEVHASKLALVG